MTNVDLLTCAEEILNISEGEGGQKDRSSNKPGKKKEKTGTLMKQKREISVKIKE